METQVLPEDLSFSELFYAENWPIYERSSSEGINKLIDLLSAGVNAGSLLPEILRELAVFDYHEQNPVIIENDFVKRVETDFGQEIQLKAGETKIWHITEALEGQINNIGGDEDIGISLFS
jgi:hypothetical protein